ncbi:MAG: hypothetical protein QOG72_1797 [Sphingomonadales bacterium]|jgi:hypothetical protein|nr:hypothetical protein [Sphingomonadales bacterium]
MTRRRHMNEPPSRAAEIFNAHMARHEAHVARAMAAHERALAAIELRMAGSMAAHERAMGEIQRRMEAHLGARGRRKPPGPKRRRDEEGGDAVPAVPRPKPNPLAGAAAAPIEGTDAQSGRGAFSGPL